MAFGLAHLTTLLSDSANKLFNKKQNKIRVSFLRPNAAEEGDIWIDTGEHSAQVFNKPYIDDNFLSLTAVIEQLEASKEVNISGFVEEHLSKDINISADIINNTADKYIDIMAEVSSNWVLKSGRKEYDRMYGKHFRTAYYGYYTPAANWIQDQDRPPVQIGSIQSAQFDIDGKPFYILSLMAYYDEDNTASGNGFNVLFTIRTPDRVIPFDNLTITINHQFRYPKRRDVVYTKTITAEEFDSEDLLVRHATWADETNGAIPKLFEILYDLNHYSDIPVNIDLKATVNGNTYGFTKTTNALIHGKDIDIPVEEIRKITDTGDIDIQTGYNTLGKYNNLEPVKSIIIKREKDSAGRYIKYLEVEFSDVSYTAANITLRDNYDSGLRIKSKDIVNNKFKVTDPYKVKIWSEVFNTSLSSGTTVIFRIEDKEDQIHYED